jgi:hypothetical protein
MAQTPRPGKAETPSPLRAYSVQEWQKNFAVAFAAGVPLEATRTVARGPLLAADNDDLAGPVDLSGDRCTDFAERIAAADRDWNDAASQALSARAEQLHDWILEVNWDDAGDLSRWVCTHCGCVGKERVGGIVDDGDGPNIERVRK